jgi:hypothetical protein
MDTDMAVGERMVTQGFAGSEASTVEAGEVKLFRLSESGDQNPLRGKSGKAEQQCRLRQPGIDVPTGQHPADRAPTGFINGSGGRRQASTVGYTYNEASAANTDRRIIIQVQFHELSFEFSYAGFGFRQYWNCKHGILLEIRVVLGFDF